MNHSINSGGLDSSSTVSSTTTATNSPFNQNNNHQRGNLEESNSYQEEKTRITNKFHFNLIDTSNHFNLNDDDSTSAEKLWKLYHKAKESLPYKKRMENLTWRMMFVNHIKDQKSKEEEVEVKNEDEDYHQFLTSPVINSINQKTSPNLDPAADEFDYVAHIRKMGQDDSSTFTNPNNLKKRSAPFSPLILASNGTDIPNPIPNNPVSNSKNTHSNLSASLAAAKRENNLAKENGGFAFSLDPLAFESPMNNISNSLPSSTSISQTSKFSPQSTNSFDKKELPLTTIGPSSILNNNQLSRQDHSMVSLMDHFNKSRSTTPFTSHSQSLQNPPQFTLPGQSIDSLHRNNSFLSSAQQSPAFDYKSNSYFDNFDHPPSSNHHHRLSIASSTSSTINQNSNGQSFSLPSTWNESFINDDNLSTASTSISSHNQPDYNKRMVKKSRSSTITLSTSPSSNLKKKNNETIITTPQLPSSNSKKISNDELTVSCTNCHTKTTPLWRRNPQGEPLCNACGLFLKLHGVVRPLSLKTDVIKKRQRGANNPKKNKSIKDGDDLNPTSIKKFDDDKKNLFKRRNEKNQPLPEQFFDDSNKSLHPINELDHHSTNFFEINQNNQIKNEDTNHNMMIDHSNDENQNLDWLSMNL